MRQLVIAAALALGACSVETGPNSGPPDPAGGYEMQIAARDKAQIYYVTGPDGQRTAARVENGVSSVMDADEARLALGEARAAAAELGPLTENQRVKISVPGFDLSIAADDDSTDPNGRAQISINAGGRQVNVDAAGEDDSGRALVRIAGASEHDARDFIEDAHELSAETRQQMLEQLGLSAAE